MGSVFMPVDKCTRENSCLQVGQRGEGDVDDNLYIIGRFCLSVCLFVTFLFIYGSQSVFMVFHGSRLVFHVSRLVFHGFS